MENPLVSVIIPVYRVESFLPKCLDSVINQTYKNIEVICIDDGSDDRSGVICDEYAKKDSRIKVIHKNNEGVGAARYEGVKIMDGTYATFVDPDDYISPNAIGLLVDKAIEYDVELVVAQHYNKKGESITPFHSSASSGFYDRIAIEKMLKTNFFVDHIPGKDAICLTLWGKLFKKEGLKEGLKEGIGYKLSQDSICLFAMMKIIQTLYVLDDYIYYYVFHPSQASKAPKNIWWKYQVLSWKKVSSLDEKGYLVNQIPTKLLQDFKSAVIAMTQGNDYKQYRKLAVEARKDDFHKQQLWNNHHALAYGMTSKTLLHLMRWRCYFIIWMILHFHLIDKIVHFNSIIKNI